MIETNYLKAFLYISCLPINYNQIVYIDIAQSKQDFPISMSHLSEIGQNIL